MEPVNGLASLRLACASMQVSSSGNLDITECVMHALACALELRSHPLSRQTKKPSTREGFFRMEPVNGLASLRLACASMQVSSSGNLDITECVMHALACALELRSHPLSRQTKKPSTREGFFKMEPVNGFEPLTY